MFKKILKKMFKSDAEKAAERAAREEEYFKRTSNKYYREEDSSPNFDKDYFKSTDEGQEKEAKDTKAGEAAGGGEKARESRRTTIADSGVTIIDERDESRAKRKIFAPEEGEYVEFSEG